MNEKPGHSPGKGLFRRRIVFELDADQLPVLEAAEQRHGTKRAALIAALSAETGAVELLERAERAEKALAKAKSAMKGSTAAKERAANKMKRDVEAARKKLAERDKELGKLRAGAEESSEKQQGELARAQEEIDDLEAENAELVERAVDWIFCNHCREWVAPDEWTWQRIKGGGSYAHHGACGEHQPGVLGASSWLARRDN